MSYFKLYVFKYDNIDLHINEELCRLFKIKTDYTCFQLFNQCYLTSKFKSYSVATRKPSTFLRKALESGTKFRKKKCKYIIEPYCTLKMNLTLKN